MLLKLYNKFFCSVDLSLYNFFLFNKFSLSVTVILYCGKKRFIIQSEKYVPWRRNFCLIGANVLPLWDKNFCLSVLLFVPLRQKFSLSEVNLWQKYCLTEENCPHEMKILYYWKEVSFWGKLSQRDKNIASLR